MRSALDVIPFLVSIASWSFRSAASAVHSAGSTLHHTDPKPGLACAALLAYCRTFRKRVLPLRRRQFLGPGASG